jgi:hypothetical protein
VGSPRRVDLSAIEVVRAQRDSYIQKLASDIDFIKIGDQLARTAVFHGQSVSYLVDGAMKTGSEAVRQP